MYGGRGRPIFILGCPRSGTTLLSLMLHQHPRIAIPPENRFLLPTYFDRADFGDLADEANRRALAEKIVDSHWFADLRLDPERIVEQVVDEAWTVGSAVGLVLRAYSEQSGKLRWGDKRPYYRNAIWLIRRMFPDAQFVHIIRDGRDAVASMKHVPPWNEQSFDARVCAWIEAVDQAKEARDKLTADTFYELQYERLVTEPKTELAGLCEFLGEEIDEAMLRPERLADHVVPEHQTWHVLTRQEVSPRSIGTFRERLEPGQLGLAEAVMGDRLAAYGYELVGAEPPAPQRLEEYTRYERKRLRHLRQLRRKDKAIDYPWPVADMGVSEAKLHRKVARLKRRVARLTTRRNNLRTKLDNLTQTRSWRWTTPLRNTYRATKGH
jgi:hypothetical protein